MSQLTLFSDVQPAAMTTHMGRLRAALGGSLADWVYRGECIDLGFCSGRCACGQAGLRYQFTIHHDRLGERKVGSFCIGLFQAENPNLIELIERDRERLEKQATNKGETSGK